MIYMLDTNTVSDVIRKDPNVIRQLKSLSPESICLSGITAAEIIYGLEKLERHIINFE